MRTPVQDFFEVVLPKGEILRETELLYNKALQLAGLTGKGGFRCILRYRYHWPDCKQEGRRGDWGGIEP